MSHHKPIKALLALQGGGSAGSFTWGVLDRMLDNTDIEPFAISGTSAGAMNGRKIAKAINEEHGWTASGRQDAQAGLSHLWKNIIHTNQVSSTFRAMSHMLDIQQTMLSSNPYNPFNNIIDHAYNFADAATKFGYSQSLEAYLRHTNDNPDALKSNRHISLYANAVDTSGREAVWTGQDLTTKAFLASAALHEHFQPVKIGNQFYRDGAYLGGSNPNMQVLLDNHGHEADVMIIAMTNPPQHPVTPQLQKDLTQTDVSATNGLILHQVWNEVAYHMHQYETGQSNVPVIVIYPDITKPFDAKAKQRTDKAFIMGLKNMGEDRYEQAYHDSDGFTKPNMTVADIQRIAIRNEARLIAA